MNSKVYFASDFHLGISAQNRSAKEREYLVSEWIDSIPDYSSIYLLGDIFDYWFEYRQVIPRGYTHFFSSLRKAVDRGVEIVIFSGNHDMWMYDYFESEFGIKVYHKPQIFDINGVKFMLGHGDGLGPDDKKYKIVKKIFRNPFLQRLFKIIHPDFALRIMKNFSKTSRDTADEEPYFGDKEWLVQYCERKLKSYNIDYFIFGHRHLVIDFLLSNSKSRYINTGDWIEYFSYAVLDNGKLDICFYKEPKKILS